MEVVEVVFNSQEQYDNAYMDVDVWVELKNTGSANEVYRIPVFWDGGTVFRARLVATSPGNWTWKIINDTVENSDRGFIGRSGAFTAVAADVSSNPNNHGFIRVNPDTKRTLEYADGTPLFYTADTSWSALTAVFGYNNANSISGISFKDYIRTRKNQGFNGLNVIASFPDDTYLEEQGRNLDRPGTQTGLWASETWGKKTAPNGATPFAMKRRGQPVTDNLQEVDYKRIVPEYWQSVDERMQFLADQGFVTLFESVRRHERWAFRPQDEKNAFYNYIRYLWARYGCYNMIFSWVHHDSRGSIYPQWRDLVRHANGELFNRMGDHRMPFGQPRTAMSFNTSLNNWEKDLSSALDIQNVSNAERDETMHEWLTDIYNYRTVKPALNLEPFYPGWGLHSSNEINPGLDDTTMAQMQMYGSVLSGGLAGHAWGDAWYAGAATSTGRSQADGGTIVPSNDPQVNALGRFDSQAMGHLKRFILDAGHDYKRLVPAADTNLSDNQGLIHALSISDDKELALGFFTADSRRNPKALPALTNLTASQNYLFEWWDVTNGRWISAGDIKTSNSGRLQPPSLPNNDRTKNWAYRIRSEEIDTADDDVPIANNDFVLRINSGGEQINHNGTTFSADIYSDTGRILDRPQTGLDGPFRTFRFSRSQKMGYDIPLDNGEYTVRLHFAELWFGATGGGSGGAGSRIFDVRLEGALVDDNLDVFAQVGADAVLTKTYNVSVTDEALNLDFSSLASDGGTRHPIVNAIEILGSEDIDPPSNTPSADGLVGHWTLDEPNGVIANDVSGQGHTGTLERGLIFDKDKTDGQIKGAVEFDGSDDRISLPDIDNGLQSGFSVSAWVNPSNAEGGYQGIVGSTTAGGFMMFINKGKLAFKVTTNENGQKLVSEGIIRNNVWQMVTCTFDGTDMRWYINGENVHNEPLSGTLKDSGAALIGSSGWGEEYFEGGIDDVRLFDNALTEQQIVDLFEKGNVNTTPVNSVALRTNLSLEDELDIEVFRVFPNPSKGTITVTGLLSGMQLSLIDFSGRKVASETVSIDGNVKMDLSPYTKGIYVLRVSNGAEVKTEKIILD